MVSRPGYHRASWLLELWDPVGLEASGLPPHMWSSGFGDFWLKSSPQGVEGKALVRVQSSLAAHKS